MKAQSWLVCRDRRTLVQLFRRQITDPSPGLMARSAPARRARDQAGNHLQWWAVLRDLKLVCQAAHQLTRLRRLNLEVVTLLQPKRFQMMRLPGSSVYTRNSSSQIRQASSRFVPAGPSRVCRANARAAANDPIPQTCVSSAFFIEECRSSQAAERPRSGL